MSAESRERKENLLKMTGDYCTDHLDDEYRELAKRLIDKTARKRDVPFLRGRLENWAAAVIHAFGQINFLFDKSFEPYVEPGDIASYFKADQSTIAQKAKVIRHLFKLAPWDSEFSTKAMSERSPAREIPGVLERMTIASMRETMQEQYAEDIFRLQADADPVPEDDPKAWLKDIVTAYERTKSVVEELAQRNSQPGGVDEVLAFAPLLFFAMARS